MKVFLTSFGRRAHGWKSPPPGQLLPPMLTGESGLYLDVAPLFIAPTLIMDRLSFDVMTDKTDGLAPQIRQTLSMLSQEGLLETHDYSDLTPEERERVRVANENASTNPGILASRALQVVDDWYDQGRPFAGKWSTQHAASGRIPYALNTFLKDAEERYDDTEYAEQRWREIKLGYADGDPDAAKALTQMGQVLADHHNTTIVLGDKFEASSYHWRNLASPSEFEGNGPADNDAGAASGRARAVFEVMAPGGLEQASAAQLARLFSHSSVKDARAIIAEIVNSDISIPEQFMSLLIGALNAQQIKATKITKLRKWMRGPKFLFGLLPGGGTVAEVGHAAAEAIVETAVDHLADKAIDHSVDRTRDHITIDQKKLANTSALIAEHLSGNYRSLADTAKHLLLRGKGGGE